MANKKNNQNSSRGSAQQGSRGGNATANARTERNRRRRAAKKRNRAIANATFSVRDYVPPEAKYALARDNPFHPAAAGAKLLDFDTTPSCTCDSDQEWAFPSTAATYTSGVCFPVANFAVATLDGSGSTSSNTVLDLGHKNTIVSFDDYGSGGDLASCASYRPVGGGIEFTYRGAPSTASGELIFAPLPLKTYDAFGGSAITTSQLVKLPGCKRVLLSSLNSESGWIRFTPSDYTHATYQTMPVVTGWTGCIWAVTGAPSGAGYLGVRIRMHWEYLPGISQMLRATPAFPYRPSIIAQERARDANPANTTGVIKSSLLDEVTALFEAENLVRLANAARTIGGAASALWPMFA